MGLEFELRPSDRAATDEDMAKIMANPGFGNFFTDHMAVATWTKDAGWHDAQICAYGPFSVDPATGVLHYAQEVFEGMKAFRKADGSVWMFRPDMNAKRMMRSAERMGLPQLPAEDFLAGVEKLVEVDSKWVPEDPDSSLYIRPFLFASEAFLGVRGANKVTFCTIASPVGPYFSGGVKPITIWITKEYTRAAAGGTGTAKCGGNYAGGLMAQNEAYANGCNQVLFLDAKEHRYLEELGGMNVFMVTKDGELVTPELGTILEGITRDSILQIGRDLGMKVTERKIDVDELLNGIKSGEIVEFFACGTAAAITPIGGFKHAEGETKISDEPGEWTMKLRNHLLGIQHGEIEDKHGWMHKVEAK